jgi:hypothetical protein
MKQLVTGRTGRHPGGQPRPRRWCEVPTPHAEQVICGLRLPCPDHDRRGLPDYADPAGAVDIGDGH